MKKLVETHEYVHDQTGKTLGIAEWDDGSWSMTDELYQIWHDPKTTETALFNLRSMDVLREWDTISDDDLGALVFCLAHDQMDSVLKEPH